jgi:4-hydroxythreonine-4-phosphate dehydrogenase
LNPPDRAVTTKARKPLAITAGEPAGIGPELCISLASTEWIDDVIIIADPDMLSARATQLGLNLTLAEYSPGRQCGSGALQVLPQRLVEAAECGNPNPANSRSLLDGIERAVKGCLSGEFAGLVTAPLQKSVIVDAGIAFSGHTEFLAGISGAATPVMLLVAGNLRVALASTHMPLKDVPGYLTTDGIIAILDVLHRDLRAKFAIDKPRILVCGLNPHAGEQGHLGSEDAAVILPAIEDCRSRGMEVEGPLPADTAFTPIVGKSDAILAMYHDQGLPVIKYAGFGTAVNVTLGLPFVRTSVDHGTALDIAGHGTADNGSLIAAIKLAADLATRQ